MYQMKQKKGRSKMCLLDIEDTKLTMFFFGFMMFLSGVIATLNSKSNCRGMFFLHVDLLLSSVIPIFPRVILHLSKLYYSFCIIT